MEHASTPGSAKDPQRPLRVLLPLRLDVLGRAMDSGVWQMWLELDGACELVPYGPGFDGWSPSKGAGAAARAFRADLLLLGDLTHSIPGLWDELWHDVADCGIPSVMFVSDPGSATEARIQSLDDVRPTAIMTLGYEPSYAEIDVAARARGIRILRRHLGHDPALFFPPSAPTARDIDVLVCGAADPHAYPIRRRIQSALRGVAATRRVMDLTHPGYWETDHVRGGGLLSTTRVAVRMLRDGGWPLLRAAIAERRAAGRPSATGLLPAPERHGQATFADLARRSKVVVTGTTFGIVSAKHYEVAACGAVGVGDMPDQPEQQRFADAMLRVEADWSEARIAREVEALLDDEVRLERAHVAALDAVRGCSHAERVDDVVAQLLDIASIGDGDVTHVPVPRLPAWIGVIAAPADDPTRGRHDWIDVRETGTRDAIARCDAPVVVVASTPEAALPPDATWLAAQVTDDVVLARRPMSNAGSGVDASTWALAAVATDVLREALEERGSIDAALAAIESARGARVAELGGFLDPDVAAAQLQARMVAGVTT